VLGWAIGAWGPGAGPGGGGGQPVLLWDAPPPGIFFFLGLRPL
jgi:hypothetical protein